MQRRHLLALAGAAFSAHGSGRASGDLADPAFTGETVAMGEGWVVRAPSRTPGTLGGVHNLGRLGFDA